MWVEFCITRMEILLLIISDWNLRQLYHELLFSKNMEVIPIDSIENAILILSLNKIDLAVIYVDDENVAEFEIFINLREKHKNISKVKIVLLTSFANFSFPFFPENELVLNVDTFTPVEVTERIRELLDQG